MIKTKKFVTIEELKNMGYEIKVYHYRKFMGWGDMMTKPEFVRKNPGYTVGLHIDSYGGFTTVEVTNNGLHAHGKFNTPAGLQFNRKLGLTASLGRAMKNMNIVQSVGWSECNNDFVR